MWPRKLIDIAWSDLAMGAIKCVWPGHRARTVHHIEDLWMSPEQTLTCLSVRSGFDLLLQSLRLPAGSEVLMSALTVHDMARVVQHHGLIPVPLDLDPQTLEPSLRDFQEAVGPATRAIVVAPLFGARSSLAPIAQACRDHGLYVIEDCAQAYCGPEYTGNPETDASLFSFGPIKTATALGGAVICSRDPKRLAEMRQIQEDYPVQSNWLYARRLLKYAGLKLVSQRNLYGFLFRTCRIAGCNPDRLVNSVARNFRAGDLIRQLRVQPAAALLSVLCRRLQKHDSNHVRHRAALGRQLARRLGSIATVSGHRAPSHTYWVFPVLAHDPDRLITELGKHGFDATQGGSMATIGAPDDGSSRKAPCAQRMLQNIVFVPMYSKLPDSALRCLAEVIWQQQDRTSEPVRVPTCHSGHP